MIPFLQQIAELVAQDPGIHHKTFIFPNRRAPLFFYKRLSECLAKPIFAPKCIPIESFFLSLCPLQESDRFTLVYRLYQTYKTIIPTTEPFYHFYNWGEMLLHDFDEIDKYLVDATRIFRDLSRLKELDNTFDFMTQEQKEFLKIFWKNIGQKPTKSRKNFIKVWESLPVIYTKYTASLKACNIGYEGMIQKEAIQGLTSDTQHHNSFTFVGFNALTKVEERLICHYVERGATIYWDTDAYYMEDTRQEAGHFLRQYRKHPILSRTFTDPPAHIAGNPKTIQLIGAPHRIGQARMTGQHITEHLASSSSPENTVVVLPDESPLLPVLNALPSHLSKINITMGYPFGQTLLYTLLDLAIALQKNRKGNRFYHRHINALIMYTRTIATEKEPLQQIQNRINTRNKIYISSDELQDRIPFGELWFCKVSVKEAIPHLLNITEIFEKWDTPMQSFDRQCASYLYQYLSRIHDTLEAEDAPSEWRDFQDFFRRIVRPQKIPFSGEPLKGLQIMGMLETRNLDFENVHILSLNEGLFPLARTSSSYISYHIRRAYQLPTHHHQNATHAYLFYRLLQRSKHVWMYYNTQVDIHHGEMSRYVKQLLYESDLSIQHRFLHNAIHVPAGRPIIVQKTKEVYAILKKYQKHHHTTSPSKPLTPSAINDYIECRLRFYFKYIASIREAKKVEEDPDARIFGNLLHDTMYFIYGTLAKKNKGKITKTAIEASKALIHQSIDQSFIKHHIINQDASPIYRGQHLIAHHMIQEWVKKIMELDKAYTPFKIVALEQDFNLAFPIASQTLHLGGKIDRIDCKKNIVRIMDYKTGADETTISDIASLFDRDKKRNKAALQTMLYAYLYYSQPDKLPGRIVPGIMNRKNVFAPDFQFGHTLSKKKSETNHMELYIDEFTTHLHTLLTELYDESIPFDQTHRTEHCKFCTYRHICHK